MSDSDSRRTRRMKRSQQQEQGITPTRPPPPPDSPNTSYNPRRGQRRVTVTSRDEDDNMDLQDYNDDGDDGGGAWGSAGGDMKSHARMPQRRQPQQDTGVWQRMKRGIGKKKKNQTPQDRERPPPMSPEDYNRAAAQRRQQIISQMVKKSGELAEMEYDRFLDHKEREKKQREEEEARLEEVREGREEARLEERLYKQAARGQLDCDDHEKTLYSLNHLLKMERRHDDSMIASICDVVLQKPELRAELMEFVQREHRVVSSLLDEEARRNPTRNIQRLENAMADLNTNSKALLSGAASMNSSRRDVASYEELNETERGGSRRGSGRRDTVNSIYSDRDMMQAKAPGYPAADSMADQRTGGAPVKHIEDPELADYVKSLESTVDDKLRVLLDTHSNRTDAKMNGDTPGKTGKHMMGKTGAFLGDDKRSKADNSTGGGKRR